MKLSVWCNNNIRFLFIILCFLLVIFGLVAGYKAGYENGLWDGEYNNFDEIWNSGYSDGFVSGYQESIYWYPVFSHDIYVRHYNNSVWNWTNGTSAEDSFNELKNKYYDRRR